MNWDEIALFVARWDIGMAAVVALVTNWMGIWRFRTDQGEAEHWRDLARRALGMAEHLMDLLEEAYKHERSGGTE